MRRAQIAVAFGANALAGLSTGAAGVILPAQLIGLSVDKATFGATFLTSGGGYMIAAFTSGSLLYRFGVRTCLAAWSAVGLAAAAGIVLFPTFPAYLACTAMLGWCNGGSAAALNSYLSTFDRPVPLLNSLHAFFGIGALAGPQIASSLLSQGHPWTSWFVLAALLFAPLLACFLVFYPKTPMPQPGGAAAPPVQSRMALALRHPAVWLGAAFLAFESGIELSLVNWSVVFLTEERGQGLRPASLAMSGYWLALIVGRLVINRVASRVGIGTVGLVFICLAAAAASALIIWLIPGGAFAGLALIGFFLGPLYPMLITVLPRLAPPGLLATAVGASIGISVLGSALFPATAGWFGQRFGAWSLFPFSIGLAALVGLTWWSMGRRLARTPQPVPVPVPAPASASAPSM